MSENQQIILLYIAPLQDHHDIGFEEVNNWHRARGWIGCGYHFIKVMVN